MSKYFQLDIELLHVLTNAVATVGEHRSLQIQFEAEDIINCASAKQSVRSGFSETVRRCHFTMACSVRARRRFNASPMSRLAACLTLLFLTGNILLIRYALDGKDFTENSDHTVKSITVLKSFMYANVFDKLDGIGRDEVFHFTADQWRFDVPKLLAPLESEARLRRLMENKRVLKLEYPNTILSNSEYEDLDCATIANITNKQFLSSGWTKAVYWGKYKNQDVAIKTVDVNGHDMSTCMGQSSHTARDCYSKSAAKILKEIFLLRTLVHPNIIKVLGYCIPNREFTGEGGLVVLVTELGEPLDIIKLLQMSWEDRLRISLGMAHLLHFMSHSPLGSISMNDFRRQQFVMVNGQLKLSDVDDVGLEDPPCTSDVQCTISTTTVNTSFQVPCHTGKCQGFNEKHNIFSAGRHFITFLLPHGAPPSLRPFIDQIVTAYSNASWGTKELVQKTEKVVNLFINGDYLNRTIKPETEYRKFESSDFPGLFDYRCQLSLSWSGCTLSVFDVREAEYICSIDPDCNAFVVTKHTTWTGRTIVHFKSNYTVPSRNPETTLYVKNS